MSNEETVQKIIDLFDCREFYESKLVVGELITEIVSVFGEESNDVVVGTLEELAHINDLVSEENFVEIENRLNCLRDNLVNGDIPKVIINKNLVISKVFRDLMKDPVKKAELNRVIRETLET